jgi:hypothetical protein
MHWIILTFFERVLQPLSIFATIYVEDKLLGSKSVARIKRAYSFLTHDKVYSLGVEVTADES